MIYLGPTSVLLAIFFMPWEILQSKKDSLKGTSKYFVPFILMILGGILHMIGVAASLGVPGGVPEPKVFGVLLLLIGFPLEIKLTVERVKAYKDRALVDKRLNLNKFYYECVSASCTDFSAEKNVAKAKLIADKYNMSYPNGIENLYNNAKEANIIISRNLSDEKLAKENLKQKEEQKKEYALLNRYAQYYGRDKKIAILTDRMNELLRTADSLQNGVNQLVKSAQERELDWAILGGFADGIAGPAAGIATALNVQAKNVEIRARNEATIKAAVPLYMFANDSASDNRRNAQTIKKQIESIKVKLISDTSDEDIMNNLKIYNETVDVFDTGAFKVEATVKTIKKFIIFGDVPAIADGTIIAHVFEDGKEIGVANMTIPLNGVSGIVNIMGMGLAGASKNKSHTVTFSPGQLWLIER